MIKNVNPTYEPFDYNRYCGSNREIVTGSGVPVTITRITRKKITGIVHWIPGSRQEVIPKEQTWNFEGKYLTHVKDADSWLDLYMKP